MDDIPPPSLTETPEQTSNDKYTPQAQRVNTDHSTNFDSTPFAKMDMSPPFVVEPGKGTGHIKKQVLFAEIHTGSEAGKGELEPASPIFAHRAQYPALGRHDSDDMMEGVEQTSNSRSDTGDNSSGEEEMIQALAPSIENTSQDLDDLMAIQIEWIGTSTFFLEHNIELQKAVSCSKLPLLTYS